ncbi:apolipoprotein N-acyltransferase [Salinarimonas soli]|uniref:Apolipoprotein N-acyltransferase n=1 Tax=Salinarimonas soli TaxID=1638099 RepID=A0A5B2VBF3_9HYPH|nr:apolipoprotein N-acyltransferase [Salinarimonas soli]KAA2236813.1 apolipoprotein N-acyltransferase [Salinarimonas soli]
MRALAHRVILAWGWARALIAFIAGAVGAFAMPPFGILPALAVSLTVAVWLLDGTAAGPRLRLLSTLGSAALVGWAWGFGYFVAGLWWLGSAFLVEADQFAYLLPFGVLGLPAVLAAFPALGFAAARLMWSPGPARLFALAAGLSLSEWLRGTLFTGFPWNTLGMALGQNLWLMQAGAAIGLYGLTVLAVLICAAPAALGTGESSRARLTPPLAAGLALGVLAFIGVQRLPAAETPAMAGVRLRIMQPNLPQDAKFNPANRESIMARYLALSDRATGPGASGIADVTHLIWPESAFPFLLHRDARALAQIAGLLPPGTTLVTGAARADDPGPGESRHHFFNAIHAVADDGTIVATYDKTHLVPFGEYFPHALDALLRGLGLRQFVHVPGGFEPGERPGLLDLPGLPPAAATICYEAIFPGAVVPRGPRPGLIVNVTNDAWFGMTPGPHQHFAQARLRAVEEGLPLVRAANTGISAVIDPYGRIVRSLPLGVEGVLDAPLPIAIARTTYGRFGDSLFAALALCCAALALVLRRERRRA